MDLKKQLEAAQKKSAGLEAPPAENGITNTDPSAIKQIEQELDKQVSKTYTYIL